MAGGANSASGACTNHLVSLPKPQSDFAKQLLKDADNFDLLKRIASRLAAHQKEQADEPTNWGYPGDLGRITEPLAYVLADLGDRSAVNAKGLEY